MAQFQTHAKLFGSFVDSILQTLGPDAELMQGVLRNVGAQCAGTDKTGGGLVAADGSSLLTYLGDAMILAMEQCLKRDITLEEQTAFDEVYYVITEEVRQGMNDLHFMGNDSFSSMSSSYSSFQL
eukprot:CAMPEP_0172447010 /NCGR_PEP_ID=MMETSP1065-20121228/6412_1 /TAXON_ID=265537 /ORGANISM="Amphiprora paludosa, Strain CCMP125" /LENGTH=124 /DNA_ID=CAMNT_0013198203 /DNA_START=47 /DNA_END=421 /DNA_ORIENTATION=-